MTRWEASKDIPDRHSEPCFEYEEQPCRACSKDYPELDLPPHCGYCGYVKEDHEKGNSE